MRMRRKVDRGAEVYAGKAVQREKREAGEHQEAYFINPSLDLMGNTVNSGWQ